MTKTYLNSLIKTLNNGTSPAHFSFNTDGGRCEECQGAGTIVVEGTPEEVAQCKESHTGHFLKEKL